MKINLKKKRFLKQKKIKKIKRGQRKKREFCLKCCKKFKKKREGEAQPNFYFLVKIRKIICNLKPLARQQVEQLAWLWAV